ncbi:zinc-binding dehydrogenase [Hydrogenibacillus sp. N12]|uniref:zinc-binding dehydrogenase n=1 Tax=Hydrogenibacillus sp. N12 TaxID=2866627 RepID=UPI001C7DCAAD|nr:zinc-binding dehydrogenase [Hydrogenibacillus sp. N12]QZA32690.1 zinc-binding dehydrogenase [Hydrogenibacillus sp. N12]
MDDGENFVAPGPDAPEPTGPKAAFPDGEMRAAVFYGVGERMRIERLPIPKPGPGEVLVRVAACGVCHSDLHVLRGEIAFPTPAVLGHEISGTVAAVGPGVTAVAVGDRVVGTFILPCGRCEACAAGRDDLCENFFRYNRLSGRLYDGRSRLAFPDGRPIAMYSMGGLAEYAVLPETAVYRLPDGLPLHPSAVLGCAVMTAYGAVRHGGDVRPGETVAVVAVGGVGLNVVQWARRFGARTVIAIDVEPAKLELARRLGATEAVLAEEAREKVRAMTGGKGVDVAFEALGRPETVELALSLVRDGGRLVAIGLAAGEAKAEVPITHLVRRGLSIRGSYGARVRQDLPTMLALVADGAIDLAGTVTRVYDLAAVNTAYADLAARKIAGRAIVRMAEGGESRDA